MIGDLPSEFKWIDWWVPMIREANHLQKLGEEIRRAEGSIKFVGYTRNRNKEAPVRGPTEVKEEQTQGVTAQKGENQRGDETQTYPDRYSSTISNPALFKSNQGSRGWSTRQYNPTTPGFNYIPTSTGSMAIMAGLQYEESMA